MPVPASPAFWVALGNIILVNLVLSGDNAVVIALAARSLPAPKQRLAIVWGSVAAILMRIVLTLFAIALLGLPWLKVAGGILLFVIGVQLLAGEGRKKDVKAHDSTLDAIRTILLADVVMSLDNVLGVAAAAQGDMVLLAIGLAISVPLIVFGSTLILRLMERLPVIIVLGAALLGYLAGEMLISDVAVAGWVAAHIPHHDLKIAGLHLSVPGLVGAVSIVLIGQWLARRRAG